MKRSLLTVLFISSHWLAIQANAQAKINDPATLIFKTIDTVNLSLKIYRPANFDKRLTYPVIIFFFGGGWNKRNADQFIPQAHYFTDQGMVAILADYRVYNIHKTSPFEAVRDAKSAIRYIKINHIQLNIDTNRLVAAGGSAGGQLAAACDLTKLDEANEDLSISSRPKALVLFNPVINNGRGNYGFGRVKDRYAEISPYHNITKGAAPAIIFSGTADTIVTPSVLQQYQKRMQEFNNRCELYLYKDKIHGFYTYRKSGNNDIFYDTMEKTTVFLNSLGIITSIK
jgi:acetyl esterase/lipase